jgi:hypothetical protein
MKKKSVLMVVLVLLLALLFSACPSGSDDDGYDDIDERLAGNWQHVTDPARNFTINPDGTFLATVDPIVAGASTGAGVVTGKLLRDGNDYFMTNMLETSGAQWGSTVTSITLDQPCQLTFPEGNNNTFDFTCSGTQKNLIEEFFGGTYNRTN